MEELLEMLDMEMDEFKLISTFTLIRNERGGKDFLFYGKGVINNQRIGLDGLSNKDIFKVYDLLDTHVKPPLKKKRAIKLPTKDADIFDTAKRYTN